MKVDGVGLCCFVLPSPNASATAFYSPSALWWAPWHDATQRHRHLLFNRNNSSSSRSSAAAAVAALWHRRRRRWIPAYWLTIDPFTCRLHPSITSHRRQSPVTLQVRPINITRRSLQFHTYRPPLARCYWYLVVAYVKNNNLFFFFLLLLCVIISTWWLMPADGGW